MEKIVCGRAEGYLIPKKVVEDKLRENFPELKNKEISRVWAEFSSCTIWFDEPPKLKKRNDYYISVEKTTPREVERIVVDKKKIIDIFGLTGNLVEIDLRYVKENKVHAIEQHGLFVDEDNLYYFFQMREYCYEKIGKID